MVKISFLVVCLSFNGIASVYAQSTSETNTSIITAADIQREHPASISDLLRTRAGVDNSSGAITMRGVQGIAVMLNGLPSSMTDLGQLSLDDIERIEILRGAASARFGANAMGGAIVVTTRRGAVHPVLTLLGSSSGSLGARFGGELALESWRFGLTLKDENERNYRAVPDAPFTNQITVEDERSRRKAVALRVNYQKEREKLGIDLKQSDTMAHYGRPNWWEHYVVTSGRLNGSTTLDTGAELSLQAGRESYDDPGLLDAGTSTEAAGLAPSRYILSSGSKNDFELALAHQDDTTEVRVGTAYRRSRDRTAIRPYTSNGDIFVIDSVTVNNALFVHLDRRIGTRLGMAFDGRLDRHEYPSIHVFDVSGTASAPSSGGRKQAFNPKLEARWQITEQTRLNASLGTGFIPPSPEQLYYSDKGAASWMLGNPDLKPQRSRTQDIGMNVKNGDEWSYAASLFHTAWTDKIGVAIVDYGTPFVRQYANIGEVDSKGLELEASMRLAEAWSATLNYTYNRTSVVRDQAHPDQVGNSLPDMPQHKLNAALGYESARLSGLLAMRAFGVSYTDEANTVVDAQGHKWAKNGYAVLDATMTRRYSDVDVTLSLDNLLNQRYATGFFRIGQPRLLRIEVKWRM